MKRPKQNAMQRFYLGLIQQKNPPKKYQQMQLLATQIFKMTVTSSARKTNIVEVIKETLSNSNCFNIIMSSKID